ncbi:substrate-binding domain-containing protein, partial [Escherichia coli]
KELGITAVVCWGDPSAHAFMAYCRREGIDIPNDLAVVGFNGIESPVEPAKNLTTVRAGWSQVAEGAVHLLVDRLDGSDEVPDLTVLPVEIML